MTAASSSVGGLRTELDRSYRVLGLRSDADIPEVRIAYRRLALQYHPDRNKGPEAARAFATLTEAYNTIVNSSLVAGGPTSQYETEITLEREGMNMAFTILTDKERVYHVSPMRFESEVRKRFNPRLASGIYCKVGGRWFQTDRERRSGWSPFQWGSGRDAGLIAWGRGPDKDTWKSVKWDDFWSYVRRYASLGVPRQENASS